MVGVSSSLKFAFLVKISCSRIQLCDSPLQHSQDGRAYLTTPLPYPSISWFTQIVGLWLGYLAESYLCANVRACALSLLSLGNDCTHGLRGE